MRLGCATTWRASGARSTGARIPRSSAVPGSGRVLPLSHPGEPRVELPVEAVLVLQVQDVPAVADLGEGAVAQQPAHLLRRARPVLCREGVERQMANPGLEAGSHHRAHILDAGAVADVATLRPTQAEPVWAAVATGKNPTKNGVRSAARYRVTSGGPEIDLLPGDRIIDRIERYLGSKRITLRLPTREGPTHGYPRPDATTLREERQQC
mgnify:CR=1 FL=1